MARKYPTKRMYSPHFSRKELECKCGCITPRKIEKRLRRLAIQLERLSRRAARIQGEGRKRIPIRVISGYRCPSYNWKVGGASDSMHMYGLAADIDPGNMRPLLLKAANGIVQFIRGGQGVYIGGGLHLDMRGMIGRARARWNYYKR